MKILFDGVKNFNTKDFLEHQELFRKLEKKQAPHTLFIGCSDSRVVPSLITKTLPGDLFVVRNIANLVPYYRMSNEYLSTTSAIEYAVEALNVENIVVCGHSNCGGCRALYLDEEKLSILPHTKRWMLLAQPVKDKLNNELQFVVDQNTRECLTEQLNIIEQLSHLMSYPYIKEKYLAGKLNILGWYYIIATGEIYNYDNELKKFVKIE